VQEARAKRYSMFSGYLRTAQAVEVESDEADSLQPRFQSILLQDPDAAVGRRLGDLHLEELNIEVNGVRRHNVLGGRPAADMQLRAGDVLLLLGQPMMLEAAEKRLREG